MKFGNDFYFIVRLMQAIIKFLIEHFGDDDDKNVSNHYGLIPPRKKKTKPVDKDKKPVA